MKHSFHKPVLLFVFVLLLFSFAFAQAEKEQAMELYRQGNFDAAIANLKRAVKTNPSDSANWYYLGLSYLKKDNHKDSTKAFKKAAELNPNDAATRTGLAYSYLLRNNNDEAQTEAQKALALNDKSAETHYILGVVGLRNGIYSTAYERAVKAIELNPNFASAYLLKSESLTSSFALQAGTVVKPPGSRNQLLIEATESLEKYLSLLSAANSAQAQKFHREYLESLKFFADYYRQPQNQLPKNFDPNATGNGGDIIPIQILSKPRPSYTDSARQASVTGTIRLLIGFAADGKVKHVLVIKPLGYGLDEEAVRAARQIKFIPPIMDGKPISAVKTVEYSFSIY
jgi:TonB family protein